MSRSKICGEDFGGFYAVVGDGPALGVALAVGQEKEFFGGGGDGWGFGGGAGSRGWGGWWSGETAVFLGMDEIPETLTAVGDGFMQPGGVGKARWEFGGVLEGQLVMFQGLGWAALGFAEFPQGPVELLAD